MSYQLLFSSLWITYEWDIGRCHDSLLLLGIRLSLCMRINRWIDCKSWRKNEHEDDLFDFLFYGQRFIGNICQTS